MKSTKTMVSKPEKPYDDFPLFPHATRRWAKKIKGRLHYFGPWDNWQAAYENYQHAMPYLLAGKPVPPKDLDVLTVGDLCNTFLASKESKVSSGELAQRSWNDLKRSSEILIKHVGRHTAVEYMTPGDFEKLRKKLAAGVSLVSLGNEVRRIRSIFNYATKNCLVDRVQMGTSFDLPGLKSLRKEKQSKPEKLFTIEELQTLYKSASPKMRCFMLLALNGGLGPSDIGQMEKKHVAGKWVKYPRPKTTIDRQFPLWPETLKALNQEQQTEYDSELLFITKYGQSWYKEGQADSPITKEFSKLLDDCNLKQKGRGFYALRHTFRTIADGCRDQVAIDVCMGHSDSSMGGNYRHGIEPERLQAVVDHVRKWAMPMLSSVKPLKKRGAK